MNSQNIPRFDDLTQLARDYDDIPFEAILKQDILRLGMGFSKTCFTGIEGYKPKDYFIFSFDLETLDELEKNNAHLLKAPEEIRFSGGEFKLLPTIVNVRLNPQSPYEVCIHQGKPWLFIEGKAFAECEFHPRPVFYDQQLKNGKAIAEIAPVIEWGYLIYLTLFRLCQYWGKDEECQFCDINENYRQQKKSGRPYTGVKKIEEVIEALAIIEKQDDRAKALTITGGSIITELQGKSEIDFYLPYAKAIRERFGERWLIKAVVEAYKKSDCQRLKTEGGVDIYHPNYEIWDQELFKRFCPGKERLVGHGEWMKRIVDSAEVFGPERVIPNFVAGVEMASPHGFDTAEKAVASSAKGLDFFMSKGILPRFTTWCREPRAHLKNQPAPPLEYYVLLLKTWRDLKEGYGLPSPPGYGEPGLGKAVFSVSAFMDVIRD